jgi:acyl-CoA reductase-like NAD-dependent aldehyde dehydrogenase
MAPATTVTPERPAAPSIGATRLFIDNTWVDPVDGSCFDTLNPATGEVIASVAQGGSADVDRAVKAARHALESPPYSTMDAADHGLLLLTLADLVEAYAQDLAVLERRRTATPGSQ